MLLSGAMFYSANLVDENRWEALILFGRFFAGTSHGIAYVTIFVQASENAAKDFRRILVAIIGLTIGFSMFMAAVFIIAIPAPFNLDENGAAIVKNVVEHAEMTSAYAMTITTLICCCISLVVNYFFSHETVPFLLYHNFGDEEAAKLTMAKLLGEAEHSPVVEQEFSDLRELCTADYADYPEGKLFTSAHRGLLSIPLTSRITSAQCLNILYIIVLAKFLMHDMIETALQILFVDLPTGDEAMFLKHAQELIEDIGKYRTIVRTQVSILFIGGTVVTLVGIFLNAKRWFHFTTFVTGVLMVVCSTFQFAKKIKMFALFVYVHFLSLPVDVIGYEYLSECFPISTKAKAIGFVTICENLLNTIYATMELSDDDILVEFLITGSLFIVFAYRLFCIVPNTKGLSLGAAKQAYALALSETTWKQYLPTWALLSK